MSRIITIVEKASDWSSYYPSENVMTAMDYLKEPSETGSDRVQVINLCRSYKYLGIGYYVSLLAEARGHKVIPSVRTINDLSKRALYGLDIGDLNQKLTRFLPEGGRDTTDFGVLVYFGNTSYAPLQDLARQIFEMFPCPILRIEFERQKVWQISAIRPASLNQLSDQQEDSFAEALERFSSKLWKKPKARKKYRYDVAMLHDPNELWPPSNRKALRHFVEAGKELGIEVDPVTRNDYARIAEYDALFIRETTALDHHTYRFAHKAEKEGMVVIDDPTSIMRCTNKVYLSDLLKSRRIPMPRTEFLFRDEPKKLEVLGDILGFPLVLKVPDGSFSRGVLKVEDTATLKRAADELFSESALLLAQEFMPTDFDWRIGVLNGEALFACQYFMSAGHWQIYNHQSNKEKTGDHRTLPVRDAPPEVVKMALKSTQPIGDGLYGVDIKVSKDRAVVIEVNDNPNIDAGVEDAYLGEDLYRRVMQEFLRRLELKRLGQLK
jgi:glutathione synthase/RimK-type ligase-like ATP-grasp enzyme